MSRIKIRVLWLCLMIGICCLPLIIFMTQDLLVMGKTVQLNHKNEEYEIARNHPIIASLYSEFYSTDYSLGALEYNIKEELSHNKNEEKITKMKTYFDEEINKLLQFQVIPYSLIELKDNEKFKTNFGYIKDFTVQLSNELYLTQYYRLHTDNDISTSYQYNQFSKKIKTINIDNKAVNNLTDKQLKDMCWNMVTYLELDDIDDWQYSDYTYVSEKAKLVVYCFVKNYDTFDSLTIGVSLRDNFIYSY